MWDSQKKIQSAKMIFCVLCCGKPKTMNVFTRCDPNYMNTRGLGLGSAHPFQIVDAGAMVAVLPNAEQHQPKHSNDAVVPDARQEGDF